MASCRLCGQTIRFDKTFKSEYSGKLIPLNEKVDEPHNCPKWKSQHRRYYPCRDCSAPLYFDDKHISKNGKHISLDKQDGQPHQCEEVKAAQISWAMWATLRLPFKRMALCMVILIKYRTVEKGYLFVMTGQKCRHCDSDLKQNGQFWLCPKCNKVYEK